MVAASQQLQSREESQSLVFDKAPSALAVDKRSSLITKSQSIVKRHTALPAFSFEQNPPTFRNHVRAHRTQGYVSQQTHRCFPAIGPASRLLVLPPSITPNTMRPLVQFAVRASRPSRALRAVKPAPNRFFHTSPRSLCPNSQNEHDDDYRIIAHEPRPIQQGTMLTAYLHRRLRPHPRRAR